MKYLFFYFFLINYIIFADPLVDDTSNVKIIKIYDGDTFAFKYKNELFKIRLLNVDTYETTINERLKNQANCSKIQVKTALSRGKKAKLFAEKILLNRKVKIVRDRNQKNFDVYNRLLRFVLIDDVSFEDLMIENKIPYIKSK